MNSSASSDSTPAIDRRALFTRYGKKPSYGMAERSIRYLLRSLAYLTMGVTVAIIVVLVGDAWVFFTGTFEEHIGEDAANTVGFGHFFLGTRWEPFGEPKFLGVWPLLTGTLKIAFGSILIAIPLGLGTAVYLTQYASARVATIVGPVVEILGGVPTVVYGYFALTAVTPWLGNFFGEIQIFNALSASIVVGIAILPMVSSLSAEALRLVPPAIRNAGYALGMRKFHVVTKIMIPAAFSGIVASILLAFARAVGETMAVTLAAGATPNMGMNFLEGMQTMTAFIVQISLGDTPYGSIEYYTIYALGLTLFLMTFLFNFLASRIVKRFREAYE